MKTSDIYSNLAEIIAHMRANNGDKLFQLHADVGDVLDAVFGFPDDADEPVRPVGKSPDLAAPYGVAPQPKPDFSKPETYFKEPLGPDADKPAPASLPDRFLDYLKDYISQTYGVDKSRIEITAREGVAHVRIL